MFGTEEKNNVFLGVGCRRWASASIGCTGDERDFANNAVLTAYQDEKDESS